MQGVITEIAEVMCGTAEGRQFALQNILSQMTRFLKDRADGMSIVAQHAVHCISIYVSDS